MADVVSSFKEASRQNCEATDCLVINFDKLSFFYEMRIEELACRTGRQE